YFTVTKDGTLLFDDCADSEEVEEVLEAIAAAGFECEPQDGGEETGSSEGDVKEVAETVKTEGITEETETAAAGGSPDTEQQNSIMGLTVEIPMDKVSVGNLARLLDAKGNLIKKALGI